MLLTAEGSVPGGDSHSLVWGLHPLSRRSSVVPGDQALSHRCHHHLGGRRVEKPPGPFMREPLSWAQQDIRQCPGPQPDGRRGP